MTTTIKAALDIAVLATLEARGKSTTHDLLRFLAPYPIGVTLDGLRSAMGRLSERELVVPLENDTQMNLYRITRPGRRILDRWREADG